MKSVSQQRRKGKGRRRRKKEGSQKRARERNDAMITLLVCRRRRLEEDIRERNVLVHPVGDGVARVQLHGGEGRLAGRGGQGRRHSRHTGVGQGGQAGVGHSGSSDGSRVGNVGHDVGGGGGVHAGHIGIRQGGAKQRRGRNSHLPTSALGGGLSRGRGLFRSSVRRGGGSVEGGLELGLGGGHLGGVLHGDGQGKVEDGRLEGGGGGHGGAHRQVGAGHAESVDRVGDIVDRLQETVGVDVLVGAGRHAVRVARLGTKKVMLEVLLRRYVHVNFNLKGLSGQIRSACELHHWIGLWWVFNSYMFKVLGFLSLEYGILMEFEVPSHLIQKSILSALFSTKQDRVSYLNLNRLMT